MNGEDLELIQELLNEINILRKEKKAVIVSHTYQRGEVQDISDLVGDSLELSRYCASSDAEVIVFCGVHFMAESAKILSPGKTVLLPERDAGCPLADMITAEDLRELKDRHKDAAVVCYINSSAEVKAESDICCTSSNAVNVVKSLKQKDVIFVPDKNLGSYVAKSVPGKNIILWEGFCPTHYRARLEDLIKAKELHPDALVLVHPECRPEIVEKADFVGSTKAIINYASKSSHDKFIIGTEMGVLHSLTKNNPGKKFYLLSQGFVCPNMKKTTLKSVVNSLKEMKYRIELPEEIRTKALRALQRMLEVT
ncbi:MAG: quinolinate synthase NadA [Clostridiaceae bacterium]|nr:quinolinate synthase NadA [Clostridiaceae bacterium]